MKTLTLKSIRNINAKLREIDDSHLWPINSRFNATERAIRRIRNLRHQGLELECAYSYEAAVKQEIHNIVNNY